MSFEKTLLKLSIMCKKKKVTLSIPQLCGWLNLLPWDTLEFDL